MERFGIFFWTFTPFVFGNNDGNAMKHIRMVVIPFKNAVGSAIYRSSREFKSSSQVIWSEYYLDLSQNCLLNKYAQKLPTTWHNPVLSSITCQPPPLSKMSFRGSRPSGVASIWQQRPFGTKRVMEGSRESSPMAVCFWKFADGFIGSQNCLWNILGSHACWYVRYWNY